MIKTTSHKKLVQTMRETVVAKQIGPACVDQIPGREFSTLSERARG